MIHEYIGALHIHSNYSDGTGDVETIARTADEVGLDYILLTDHNTLRALKEGYEKWYGNTLLLVGCELNDKQNKNHYLAFGINDTYSTRMSALEYVKKIKESGGFGFIAHPHEKRNHMKEQPSYPWTEWGSEEFDGIEIWNHMSEWMENLTEQNKYQFFLHPLKSIVAPPQETLKLWDELNLKRNVSAIGGIDAHAHKYNLLGFVEVEIFAYKILFKSIRTHLLLRDEIVKGDDQKSLEDAKIKIYTALKKGNSFIANDYHALSKGFRFYAVHRKHVYLPGESIEGKEVTLKVSLPVEKAEIRVYRNGKIIDCIDDNEGEFHVRMKGNYRVEVFYNGKAWIYTNNIKVI